MRLDIDTTNARYGALMTVAGPIDASNVDDLTAAIHSSVAAGIPDLLFDLEGVTSIDSAGRRALIAGCDYVRARSGTFGILRATPEITRLFKVTGVDRSVPVGEHLAERHFDDAAY